jgi:hypothetical protein
LAAAALFPAVALVAGCGSTGPAAQRPAAPARPAGPASLQTSLVTSAGTWAVAVMGHAAGHNEFWQLFTRPPRGARWRFVTPPGVADNGGLVLADAGQPLITAFRPSQYLAFTPLTATSDDGRSWSSRDPIDAALADVPDALAAAPGGDRMLALLSDGAVTMTASGGSRWSTLVTERSLAASGPGRRCGLRNLTAVTFSQTGRPLLAGSCRRRGTAGIFAYSGGTWQAAGPALPAALAGRTVTVLRLTRTVGGIAALLAAGTGPAASLLAAWSAGGGGHWSVSPARGLNGARPTSASFGPAGSAAVVLTGSRGATIAGPGSPWRSLPALPPGTATLAAGAAGGFDALATHATTLTVWQLVPGSAGWARTQNITVPIQFGSSA